MRTRWRLLPATLFGRALVTLIVAFGLFALVTFAVIVSYALVPVAQRSAADLASIMVLSARTLQELPPALRDEYRERLAREYQVRLAEEKPLADPRRYYFPYLKRVEDALSERLARRVEIVTSMANGQRWFWAAIPVGDEVLWTGFPRSRIGTRPLEGMAVILVVAVLLIAVTTMLLAGRVSSPLRRLSQAAEQVARGQSPSPLPERGPVELANLARQFNEASRQIRELLANRTMLLAGISHDLRTPLTRLRLAVAMLPETTSPELVARLERDIDEMNALITQAVEFGKSLGAGRTEELDLSALVADLVAGRPRIHWARAQRCDYRVDGLALRRIVGNLLENALRYSGGPVEVVLHCDRSPAIHVLDRGPGVPEAELEAVLRPYHRLEGSRSRETGGTGLGLAVAHQLALANQMDLRLVRRRGGGTIATIRLPPIVRSHEGIPGAVDAGARHA